jgi:PAS domain S-box-containing protein
VNANSWIDKVLALWLVAIISGVMFQQAFRKEQALVTEKNYSESILENITAGVVTIDLEGRIASINAAGGTLMEVSAWNELAGKYLMELDLGEFRRFFSSIEETLRHGSILENAPLSFFRDGREHYYEYSTGILRNREHQITGALGVIRDLSELKELENAMQTQKNLAMLGQFSAAVAHEIRNPLAVIKSSAQILAEGAEEEDAEVAGYIIEEVGRMNRLINELLNYSRPRTINLELLDVSDILARMISATSRDEDKVLLEMEEGPSPQIPGDPDMLRQAFLNILRNALDAVSDNEKGRIGIRVESGETHVNIHFEDNGPGVPPEKIEQIFQPFVTGKSKGTGLGLAITKKIVEAHRGDILVRSEPGKGSVFTVILPRTAPMEDRENEE